MTALPEFFPLEDLVPKPFPSTKWASRRLNQGVIPGTKFGRKWFMTKEDIETAAKLLRKTPTQPTRQLTAGSARRRAS